MPYSAMKKCSGSCSYWSDAEYGKSFRNAEHEGFFTPFVSDCQRCLVQMPTRMSRFKPRNSTITK